MSQKAYREGELVWAKMRGHPTWPAKVSRCPKGQSRPPGKLWVFFYGTHQHAWMLPAELCPYEDNREKFHLPKKVKGFAEAIWEIEEDPSLVISLGKTPSRRRKRSTGTPGKSSHSNEEGVPQIKKEKIDEQDLPADGEAALAAPQHSSTPPPIPPTAGFRGPSPALTPRPRYRTRSRKHSSEGIVAQITQSFAERMELRSPRDSPRGQPEARGSSAEGESVAEGGGSGQPGVEAGGTGGEPTETAAVCGAAEGGQVQGGKKRGRKKKAERGSGQDTVQRPERRATRSSGRLAGRAGVEKPAESRAPQREVECQADPSTARAHTRADEVGREWAGPGCRREQSTGPPAGPQAGSEEAGVMETGAARGLGEEVAVGCDLEEGVEVAGPPSPMDSSQTAEGRPDCVLAGGTADTSQPADPATATQIDTASTTFDTQVDAANTTFDTQVDTASTAIDTQVDAANTTFDTQVDTASHDGVNTVPQVETASTTFDTQVDAASAAIDTQVDTASTATDTQVDTASTAIDMQVDAASTATDTQVDAASTTIDTQVDAASTAIDMQVDTASTATDTQVDAASTAIDMQVDTASTATDTQVDAAGTTIDMQVDTASTATDTQVDTASQAAGTPKDVFVLAAKVPGVSVDETTGEGEDATSNRAASLLRVEEGMSVVEKLTVLNYNVKASLGALAPDVRGAKVVLRELQAVQFTSRDLLRVPDLVATIRKVRRYYGNEMVRSIAEELYSSIKSVFLLPGDPAPQAGDGARPLSRGIAKRPMTAARGRGRGGGRAPSTRASRGPGRGGAGRGKRGRSGAHSLRAGGHKEAAGGVCVPEVAPRSEQGRQQDRGDCRAESGTACNEADQTVPSCTPASSST